MESLQRVAVCVGGEFGMSPRMQYHSLSLANMSDNIEVHVIGFQGSRARPEVEDHPSIKQHLLTPFPVTPGRIVRGPLFLLVKFFFLVFAWFRAMRSLPQCSHVLVQNPPSIPVVPIAVLFCYLRGMKLVIDWHNFGYTILSLRLGNNHVLVRIYKIIERSFGRLAHSHFCVTKAMQKFLKTEWGIDDAIVLYDRPPEFFRRCSKEEKHGFFLRNSSAFGFPVVEKGSSSETIFTFQSHSNMPIEHAPDRPALIVSSTSWTHDEDFGILFDAIVELELLVQEAMKSSEGDNGDEDDDNFISFPKLVFIITGKGPQKEMYMKKVKETKFQFCTVLSAWLESRDYPILLGCADLGISLHASSSGLDLPMKVVDMFGAGLPVCAMKFNCVSELVKDRVNGRIFQNSHELATLLFELFNGFPTGSGSQLHALESAIHPPRWSMSWSKHALPVFLPDSVKMKEM